MQYLALFLLLFFIFFFVNDTATTEIYTLSLHDALPIYSGFSWTTQLLPSGSLKKMNEFQGSPFPSFQTPWSICRTDRKSTRLNSSHSQISYAVFCLKKKKDMIQIYKYIMIQSTASRTQA